MPHRLLTLFLLALVSIGCMRMIRGQSQIIDVQTNPPGARVTIRPTPGDFESPAKVALSRKPPSTVNVSEPGYRDAAYIVTASKPRVQGRGGPNRKQYLDRHLDPQSHLDTSIVLRAWVVGRCDVGSGVRTPAVKHPGRVGTTGRTCIEVNTTSGSRPTCRCSGRRGAAAERLG